MYIWKPLVKYWYSKQRKEHKYHTDFSLEEGECIEKEYLELMQIFKEKTPLGKKWKFHFEMAVETEDK